METVEEDVFALRRERIDALGEQARALNKSILELQEQVRRDLPDAEPRGVRVVFGSDGVLESVEIDDPLFLTEAELELISPSRELAERLVLGRIPSALESNYSDGVASERYRAAIDGRDDAVRGIETYASPLSQALRDLADAIERYYLDLLGIAVSLAGLIVSIAVIIATWETIVGGVLGVIGAVISVVAFLVALGDLLPSTMQAKDPVLDAFNSTIPPWPAVLS